MSFDIYGNHLRPGYCEVHPDFQHPYPCPLCVEYQRSFEQEPPEPEPNYCAENGHPYDGDDDQGGRCLCGERRYEAGGEGDSTREEK